MGSIDSNGKKSRIYLLTTSNNLALHVIINAGHKLQMQYQYQQFCQYKSDIFISSYSWYCDLTAFVLILTSKEW